MARALTQADFPLYSIGPLVYRRTESSAIFQAPDDHMAADLVLRLNRDDQSWGGPSHGGNGSSMLVYGRG